MRRFLPVLACLFGFAAVLAAMIRPVQRSVSDNSGRSRCLSNLKSMGLAVQLYLQDSNNQMFPVSSGARAWSDMLTPYQREEKGFRCPSTRRVLETGQTDYFFNARLGRKRAETILAPAQIVVFGDGPENGPSNSHLIEWPLTKNNEGFWGRHEQKGNYLLFDGAVRGQRIEQARKEFRFIGEGEN